MELELNWVGSDTGLAVLARARLFLECARSRRHLPNGQIASAIGDKCIGTVGGAVVLAVCDGASAWEAQGNGATHLIRRACSRCGSIALCADPRSIAVWPELLEPGRSSGWRGGCCSARCAKCGLGLTLRVGLDVLIKPPLSLLPSHHACALGDARCN